MNEEKTEYKREKKFLEFFKGKFNWVVYGTLTIILWINVYIRTLPMKINPITGKPGLWDITRNNWTLGPDLDPFFFLRWAKTIIEQGSIPLIDEMRYVPLGYNTLLESKLFTYIIAYFYKFLHLFSDKVTVEYAAVILPVVFSVFTVIAFFLLVRKIFEFKGQKISSIIALIASIFLVTLPSLLSRTIAGIPEKEAIGFALMFLAFYFFLCAWKSDEIKKSLFFGILAGLFTALMALIWGGVIFIFVTIAIVGFLTLLLGKINKSQLIAYSTWLFTSAIFWLPFTLRTTLRQFVTSSTTGIAIIVWFIILVHVIIFETKIREVKLLKNPKINKIPKPVQSIIISGLILILVVSIFFGPKEIFNFGEDAIAKLSNPYSDRLSFTVAENKQPFFSDWKSNFGPLFKNIPLFFWLFFIGSIFLFYEMIKGLGKEKFVFIGGYILFFLATVFSRTSSQSILNGESGLSIFIYLMGYIILIASIFYVFYKDKEKKLKNIKLEYIFLFSLIFIGIIAGRSAIRLIMVLAPIAAIPISYLVVVSVQNIFNKDKDLMKLFSVILLIIVLVSVPYTIYYNYRVSETTAKSHIPNIYTYQWQEAMAWVRGNTPQNAVFGSWWDYGYWIQTMGERATMLDGGNTISYWDYLMGRHVLTADNESEALELLYNHDVTHFLIDSTEIGKYSAYSSIGSDEDYDKFSWIGHFLLDKSQTRETKNQTTFIYVGGAMLDEDMVFENNQLLPRQGAGVGAIIISTNNIGEFQQPSAIVVYQEKQYTMDLRYLFYNETLIDFGSGIEAGAYIFPRVIQEQGQNVYVDPNGAVFYLSPKNMKALWVRLYFLKEGKNFKLVHTEQDKVVQTLMNQGIDLDVDEIIYFNGIRGPIKIWEVNYKGDEKYNEEYLMRTYPERIIERRFAR